MGQLLIGGFSSFDKDLSHCELSFAENDRSNGPNILRKPHVWHKSVFFIVKNSFFVIFAKNNLTILAKFCFLDGG